MIICILKEQALLLRTFDSFEVDTSFKRLKRKDMKEVVFARFVKEQNKSKYFSNIYKVFTNYLVITLCRVFTTQDTRKGYYLLFKRVSNIVKKLTGYPLYFHPIHGTGIQAIVMDMDMKECFGIDI